MKFSGFAQEFQSIVDTVDAAQGEVIPMDEGPEQETAIFKVLKEAEHCDKIFGCWSDSNQMRKWLIEKKKNVSNRYSTKGKTQTKQ